MHPVVCNFYFKNGRSNLKNPEAVGGGGGGIDDMRQNVDYYRSWGICAWGFISSVLVSLYMFKVAQIYKLKNENYKISHN